MNDVLFRVLMSVILVPLVIATYLICFCSLERQIQDEYAFVWAATFTGAFVIFYWLGLWRSAVKWTLSRRVRTYLSVPLAIGLPLGIALLLHTTYDMRIDGPVILASIVAIPIWLILTLLIWKETPAERAERVQASAGKALFCPKCGYNMTGLYEARCPECGERFTLDQLLGAQQRQRLPDEVGPSGADSPSRSG